MDLMGMGMRMRPPTTAMGMEDWRPQRRPPPTTVAMPGKVGKGMKGGYPYGMYPAPLDYSPYAYQGPPMGMGSGMGVRGTYASDYSMYEEDPYHSYAPGGAVSRLYKTRMCRVWKETGTCLFEERCIFAHGAAEIRDHIHHETDALHTFESSGVRIYLKPDDPLLHKREA